MNISLPDTMRDWVQSQCDTGLYANNSDYIRDLIRKDQLTKAGDLQLVLKKQKTEAAILKGLNSGEAQPMDFNQFLCDMHQQHAIKN